MLPGGAHERAQAIDISGVDVGAGIDENRDHLGIPIPCRGKKQRGLSILVRGVHVRAPGYGCLDFLRRPAGRRLEKVHGPRAAGPGTSAAGADFPLSRAKGCPTQD